MRLLIAIILSLFIHWALFKLVNSKKIDSVKFSVDLFEKETKVKLTGKKGMEKKGSIVKENSLTGTVTEQEGSGTISTPVSVEVLNPPPYPLISKKLGEEGEVMVQTFCEVSCRYEIIASSGFTRLDDAITDYMKKLNLADFKNKKLLFKFVLKNK